MMKMRRATNALSAKKAIHSERAVGRSYIFVMNGSLPTPSPPRRPLRIFMPRAPLFFYPLSSPNNTIYYEGFVETRKREETLFVFLSLPSFESLVDDDLGHTSIDRSG